MKVTKGWKASSIFTRTGSVLLLLHVGLGYAGLVALQSMDFGGSDSPGSSQRGPEPTPPADPGPFPETDPELATFYDQELDWQECGSNRECSWLTVPLDYADPDGRTIDLAVLRTKAYQRAERVGQLVVNPGGPGGSGTSYAAAGALQFGKLAQRYDIVGFDPRGVARSDQRAEDQDPGQPPERRGHEARRTAATSTIRDTARTNGISTAPAQPITAPRVLVA